MFHQTVTLPMTLSDPHHLKTTNIWKFCQYFICWPKDIKRPQRGHGGCHM